MWRPGLCTTRKISWMTTCLRGPVLRHHLIARQGPANPRHHKKKKPRLRKHLVLLPPPRVPWSQSSVCPKGNHGRTLILDPLRLARLRRVMRIPPRLISRAALPCTARRRSSMIWIRRFAPSRSQRTLHMRRTRLPASPLVGATASQHNTRFSLPHPTA